jgi:hypothetical protein
LALGVSMERDWVVLVRYKSSLLSCWSWPTENWLPYCSFLHQISILWLNDCSFCKYQYVHVSHSSVSPNVFVNINMYTSVVIGTNSILTVTFELQKIILHLLS